MANSNIAAIDTTFNPVRIVEANRPNMWTADFGPDFTTAIRRALHFVAQENSTRYNMTGVRVHPVGEHGGRVVATDGHRLVSIRLQACCDVPGLTLDSLTLARVLRQTGSRDLDMGHVTPWGVDFGRAGFVTLTSDQRFPDYTQIIPAARPGLVADPAILRKTLRSLRKVASGKDAAVILDLLNEELVLSIPSGDTKDGVQHETILRAPGSGYLPRIKLNLRYLEDALTDGPTHRITLSAEDSMSPVRISEVRSDDAPGRADDVAVVMPIRL